MDVLDVTRNTQKIISLTNLNKINKPKKTYLTSYLSPDKDHGIVYIIWKRPVLTKVLK